MVAIYTIQDGLPTAGGFPYKAFCGTARSGPKIVVRKQRSACDPTQPVGG